MAKIISKSGIYHINSADHGMANNGIIRRLAPGIVCKKADEAVVTL